MLRTIDESRGKSPISSRGRNDDRNPRRIALPPDHVPDHVRGKAYLP